MKEKKTYDHLPLRRSWLVWPRSLRFLTPKTGVWEKAQREDITEQHGGEMRNGWHSANKNKQERARRRNGGGKCGIGQLFEHCVNRDDC